MKSGKECSIEMEGIDISGFKYVFLALCANKSCEIEGLVLGGIRSVFIQLQSPFLCSYVLEEAIDVIYWSKYT